MRSIKTPLLSAAVLSTALSALAQTSADRLPGTGATSPDPSNETNQTDASGARTAIQTNARIGVGYPKTTGRNPLDDAPVPPGPSADDARRTKHKRSFWDVVLGRNKRKEPAPAASE